MKRHPYLPDNRTEGSLGLGHQHYWVASATEVDMAVAPPTPVPLRIAAAPQNVVLDARRTAIVIIDLQNDFCAKGGWVDHIGGNYEADRAPIAPLQQLLPELRAAGVPVIWVNWGNRPDLANMPPNQIHLYKNSGT
ncbi:MAG: cysteine hydrolase family protein, partial [Comamonadaceae bacterium]